VNCEVGFCIVIDVWTWRVAFKHPVEFWSSWRLKCSICLESVFTDDTAKSETYITQVGRRPRPVWVVWLVHGAIQWNNWNGIMSETMKNNERSHQSPWDGWTVISWRTVAVNMFQVCWNIYAVWKMEGRAGVMRLWTWCRRWLVQKIRCDRYSRLARLFVHDQRDASHLAFLGAAAVSPRI